MSNQPAINEDKMISLLQSDIELRSKELEIRQAEMQNNHEAAIASIEANKEVELNRKQAFEFMVGKKYRLIGIVAFLIAVVAVVGLALDKTEVVIEMLKTIVVIATTAFGAYQYGRNNEK